MITRSIIAVALILAAIPAAATPIPGTVVAAKVTTGDTVNVFPVADVNELLGGPKEVADLAARDAIPAERRREGMTAWVIAEQQEYRLIGGTANANWQPVTVTIAVFDGGTF